MWEEQKVDTASILRISEQLAAWYHQRIEFKRKKNYEGWNFNSGNYLFTTDTK